MNVPKISAGKPAAQFLQSEKSRCLRKIFRSAGRFPQKVVEMESRLLILGVVQAQKPTRNHKTTQL
jgi:hypothetical protein